MKFGTVQFLGKEYELDYMKLNELKELFQKNKEEKNKEYTRVKNICKRENIDEYIIEDIPNTFKHFLDVSSIYNKNEAIIQMAVSEKLSSELIIDKINRKRGSLNSSLKLIAPKFNNKNKNYSNIKDEFDKIIKRQENILSKISEYYDKQIESLILEKLEKEANFVGSIIKDEFFIEEEENKIEQKENDKILFALSNSVKNIISRIRKKKDNNEIDVTAISKLQDKEDIEEEQKSKLNNIAKQANDLKMENIQKIIDIENSINSLEERINDLNFKKEKFIRESMESTEIAIYNKKNNVIQKFKLFVKCRINIIDVINQNIIIPNNKFIDSYEESILKNFK